MNKKMNFAKLTALLDMHVGAEVSDGQGGQRIHWQKADPVWAAVQQRLMPKTGPWEGGQAPVQLIYEVTTHGQTKIPGLVRFRWQRHYLYPVAPCAPDTDFAWQSILCRLSSSKTEVHDD